jgi:hypothetical protein
MNTKESGKQSGVYHVQLDSWKGIGSNVLTGNTRNLFLFVHLKSYKFAAGFKNTL